MTNNRATSDEFRIVITGSTISATYKPVRGSARPVGNEERLPAKDSLPMKTVQLLDAWLNLWDRIKVKGDENRKMILSEETLRIIGRHLWSLILDNSLGEELKTEINKHKARKLRVLITFDDGSKDIQYAAYEILKGLPWEFLCIGEGASAIFLAAATNLQLARFVQLSDNDFGPSFSDTASMRVQFVTALPMTRGYGHIWEQVRLFRDAVNDPERGIVAPDPVQGLDIDAIRAALSTPFHIVHLVGLCKGSPGQPLMYLQSDGEPEWMDPTNLIQALTPDDVPRPRLVILHLCEVDEGDASENFERLAPALIARGVPAVLALQYPMAVEPKMAIGVKLYRKLARGLSIGAAVQSSRHEMLADQGRRNFGTPVLYLQEDKVLVKRNPNPQTGGSNPAASMETGTTQSPDILARLGEALISSPAEISRADITTVWNRLMAGVSGGAEPVWMLKYLMKVHENDRDLLSAINYLLKVLQSPQRGSKDARATSAKRPARKPSAQFVKNQ